MTESDARRTEASRGEYRVALGLAVVSGCAALSHQLLWTRRMIDLLGATPTATARVLGCFFLGLSLGAALATPIARRTRRPWRALAAVECGVGLLSVPLLTLGAWSAWLWPALGPERLVHWEGAGVKLLLSVVLVVPPAALMGATLPLFARAVLTRDRTLGREGNWLYAVNTAGGVLGLIATTALALQGLGVGGAMTAAMLLNVAVAAIAFGIDRVRPVARDDERGAEAVSAALPLGPLVVAFVSGLCVLAAEVLAVHLFNQVVSLAILGTGALLVTVIALLALAATAGAWLASRRSVTSELVSGALLLAAAAALATPFLFLWQSDGLRYLQLELSSTVALFMWRAIGLGLVAFGPFLFIAGLVLPLTFAWFELAAHDPHGRRWGTLLAVNGVGGFTGAELADRVLMPRLGMHLGFAAIAVVYGAVAIAAAAWTDRGWAVGGRTVTVAGMMAALAGIALPRLAALPLVRLDTWPPAKEGYRLIDLATGPEGTVATVDFGDDRVILENNQYVLGGTRSFIRQQRLALLPAVLHPSPRRTAFIGMGTGITAGAALADPAVESVTAIELSPLVADMSRRYFASASGELASDARAHVVVEDGRIAIAAAHAAYDLVVSDLFMPWQVGAGRLYTVEHFRAVRAALAPGGLFCQWLPMFQLTPEQFRVIVASFRDAFPEAYLFRDDVSEETPAFGLVGYRDATLDWTVVEERTSALRRSGKTRDGFVAFPQLTRSLYMGAAQGLSREPRRNTLDNAWLELRAGRDHVGRDWRYLDAGTWSSLDQYVSDFALAEP